MGALFDVQRVLAELDLLRVSYMSDDRDAFPLVLPSKQLVDRMKEIPARHIAQLVIDRSGGVTLDGREIEISELDEVVKRFVSEDPLLVVSLHADREAKYGQYVSVLHQLKKGGAERIFINNKSS
jgi:biopolymer transport protein ExbD